ncbi:MAG: flagellar biosynthetic protein FliO [Acidobacteriaceae bacterium]|nr:flagellar biosynthetic protein FliO [Acidobacteriaceae bacterium]
MLQQIAALFIVLILLVGTLAVLRKKGLAHFPPMRGGRGGRTGDIQVMDRISLSPQHSLFLVHVRNELILVGISPSACHRVGSFPAGAGTEALDGERHE